MKRNIEALKKEYQLRIKSIEMSIGNKNLLIEQTRSEEDMRRHTADIITYNEIIRAYKDVIGDLNGLLLL